MTSGEQEHVSDETLIDYVDDPARVPDRRKVELHISSCGECSAKVEGFRAIASAMTDEETWWILDASARSNSIRDFVTRWDAEDAEATRMLAPLLESAYRFAYANVARKRRFQTGGVVRLLCEAVRIEDDRDPTFALTLAETACFIADNLSDSYYPANVVNELRGRAWKEYSTVCRITQRFAEGFDALTRADRAYRRLIDSTVQLATVELCRAILFWEQQQYDDALRSARSAASQFAARHERDRYFEAKQVEAVILHRQGNVEAACEVYRAAYEFADGTGDAEMKAQSARNLGVAATDQGDIGTASKYLLIALQVYESLDMTALVVLTKWAIARLALAAGNPAEAAQRLRPIVAELSALELRGDAANAHLDLAEALLILGRYDEAQVACEGLFAFFRQAQMLTGAMTAAAYLREAAAGRKLSLGDIQSVRTYLAELERTPALPFVPPPESPQRR